MVDLPFWSLNDDLATIYGFADQPNWRWTHGHVENVAAAIAAAALHPRSAGEIFNVGEVDTPTMGERLTRLPVRPSNPPPAMDYDFAQDLHFQTSKIRSLIGYQDVVDEGEAMRAVATMAPTKLRPFASSGKTDFWHDAGRGHALDVN